MPAIRTYQEAAAYLAGGRNPEYRRIPSIRATTIERLDDNAIALFYHATAVVVYNADGTTEIKTGGWNTSTTKARINEFGPREYDVFQHNYEWYIMRGPWTRARFAMEWSGGTITLPGDFDTALAEHEREA